MCSLATLVLTVFAGSWAGGLVALLLHSRREIRELQDFVTLLSRTRPKGSGSTEEPFE